MEMEEITPEPDSGEGTSATQAKTEEAETDIYSKLNSPSEDLYAEARFLSDSSKQKKVVPCVQPWKGGCLCLVALCLILVLAVVVLVMKLQEEVACEVTPPKPVFEKTQMPYFRKHCQSRVCDDGWLYSSRYCFLLSSERKTWEESQTFCEKQGGSLAVITNPNLQTFLTKKAAVQYWIGLSQKNGFWTWVGGQSLRTNSFWLESNSGTGNCAILVGDKNDKKEKNWGKNLCTRPKYYICQKPMKD